MMDMNNITDDEMKQLEEDLEQELKSLGSPGVSGYGSPSTPSKDSIFKFFREILHIKDSSKVGNLDKRELGYLPNSVRDYQDIAAYAAAEGLDKVSDYLKNKAEIVLATSSSKKGFLPQLFVTNIKKEKKITEDSKPKEQGWLGKKINPQVQEED